MEQVSSERNPRAWLIQPNRGAFHREPIQGERARLTVGRDVTGDLLQFAGKTELFHQLVSFYSRKGSNPAMNQAAQFWNLAHEVRRDDYVVVAEGADGATVAIGTVVETYRFARESSPYERHGLTVTWVTTGIDRSRVRSDLRANLGSLVSVRELADNDAAARVASLANSGIDPGDGDADERAELNRMLGLAAERAVGEPLELEVLELLKFWGHQQRSNTAVAEIKRDLLASGLTTNPPFTQGGLERKVRLVAIDPEAAKPADAESAEEPEPIEEAGSESDEESETEEGGVEGPVDQSANGSASEKADETEDLSGPDSASIELVIGNLPAPTKPITTETTFELARHIMVQKNFSQLAVVDADGNYQGAVTAESIMRAHMVHEEPKLLDVLDDQIPTAYRGDHLLPKINLIFDHGFVFVYSFDRTSIDGILTAADLTRTFGAFVRPLSILEEIENRLRRAIDGALTLNEIRGGTRRGNKEVHSAADLFLGDYWHILKREKYWSRLSWRISQERFLAQLTEVIEIRNSIMHFSSDSQSKEQLDALEGLRNILSRVQQRE
ncbi:CBS domain-containing protein [Glycomyces sp. YM15]|uniref:CBS domain-containing protein n=1 Tax=Glycomyces sp. YM15 TaxID=2800446 RepID=UPI001964DB8C|nr:CBS domain-containing protein [Glycomyces sp. YM15]